MYKLRVVGDTHGDFEAYKAIVAGCEQSVQIGDFGIGFGSSAWHKEVNHFHADNTQHKFIRGNHDDPTKCQNMQGYLSDWHYDDETGIMYIGGAWSIDYAQRREYVSWWPNEELSSEQFDAIERAYLFCKPKIMVTHDAPLRIPKYMKLLNPEYGGEMVTRTALRLAKMLHRHRPEQWLFGHWHKTTDLTVDGTKFQCVGINDYVDIDVD